MIKLRQIRKNCGFSQKDVASKLKISIGTYSKIERGDIQLTVDRLLSLSDFFNLPPEEIIYFDNQASKLKGRNKFNVRFVPIAAQAGLFGDFSDEGLVQTIQFSLPVFYEKNLFMINLEGDSMYPTFCSGDYILINNNQNFNDIRWGEPYLVVSKGGQVIKRLYKSKNDSTLLLKSDNEMYQPYEIEKTEVTSIWEVKGVLSKNLAPKRL